MLVKNGQCAPTILLFFHRGAHFFLKLEPRFLEKLKEPQTLELSAATHTFARAVLERIASTIASELGLATGGADPFRANTCI